MRNLLATCGYSPTCRIDPEINPSFGLRLFTSQAGPRKLPPDSVVNAINPFLHIFEGDVCIHVGSRCRRGVAQLLLYLSEVTGLL